MPSGTFVHVKGGYYASDLEAVVACYDAGLTFTEADMRALVKTNLEFMWKGDETKPTFRKINGKYTEKGKYGKGHLWTALARFRLTSTVPERSLPCSVFSKQPTGA